MVRRREYRHASVMLLDAFSRLLQGSYVLFFLLFYDGGGTHLYLGLFNSMQNPRIFFGRNLPIFKSSEQSSFNFRYLPILTFRAQILVILQKIKTRGLCFQAVARPIRDMIR